jgi:hypothetical protein
MCMCMGMCTSQGELMGLMETLRTGGGGAPSEEFHYLKKFAIDEFPANPYHLQVRAASRTHYGHACGWGGPCHRQRHAPPRHTRCCEARGYPCPPGGAD